MYVCHNIFTFLLIWGISLASAQPQNATNRKERHINGGGSPGGIPPNSYGAPLTQQTRFEGNAQGGQSNGNPSGSYLPPQRDGFGGNNQIPTGTSGGGGFGGSSHGGSSPTNQYGAPFQNGPNQGGTPPADQYGAPFQRGNAGGLNGGLSQSINGGLSFGLLGESAKLLTRGLTLDGIQNFGRGLSLPHNLGRLPSIVQNGTNCICPDKNGWSNDQLAQHQKHTRLSAGKFDCFCIGQAGFVLVKSGPGGITQGNNGGFAGGNGGFVGGNGGFNIRTGGGTSGYDYSKPSDASNGFIGTAGTGGTVTGGYDSFGRNTASSDKPTMSCFCPKPSGWTYEQLNLLRRQQNFAGGAGDCYCANPSDVPPQLSQQLRSFRIEDPESQVDGDQNSHLAIVSLDGDLKEVRLGPLLVELS